mgnify:CR=1 FL=1
MITMVALIFGIVVAVRVATVFNLAFDGLIPLPLRIVITAVVCAVIIYMGINIGNKVDVEADAKEKLFNTPAEITLYEHGEIVYHTDNARGILKYNGYVSFYDMETNEDVWLYGTIVIRRKGQ